MTNNLCVAPAFHALIMATAPSKTATQQTTTDVQDFVSDSLFTGVIFALVLTVVRFRRLRHL